MSRMMYPIIPPRWCLLEYIGNIFCKLQELKIPCQPVLSHLLSSQESFSAVSPGNIAQPQMPTKERPTKCQNHLEKFLFNNDNFSKQPKPNFNHYVCALPCGQVVQVWHFPVLFAPVMYLAVWRECHPHPPEAPIRHVVSVTKIKFSKWKPSTICPKSKERGSPGFQRIL